LSAGFVAFATGFVAFAAGFVAFAAGRVGVLVARFTVRRVESSDMIFPRDEGIAGALALLLVAAVRYVPPPRRAGIAAQTTVDHKHMTSSPPPSALRAWRVLGVESSCDETAAAVVSVPAGAEPSPRGVVLSDVVATQIAEHAPYGGVVPELASRAHLRAIVPVLREAVHTAGGWDAIDAIAVTAGPGLVGALLVGLQSAKAIAHTRGLPLVGVNHLAGHVLAPFLDRDSAVGSAPAYPFVALLASGGHTALYRVDSPTAMRELGATRDDAAGEAFDKVAKLLGLGYPGGPVVDRLAATGNPHAVDLPMPMRQRDSLEFSFSGLKTAVAVHVKKHGVPAAWRGPRRPLRLGAAGHRRDAHPQAALRRAARGRTRRRGVGGRRGQPRAARGLRGGGRKGGHRGAHPPGPELHRQRRHDRLRGRHGPARRAPRRGDARSPRRVAPSGSLSFGANRATNGPAMADPHAHHDAHEDAHAAPHGTHHGHELHAPEEDPLRTPGWLSLLGLGLLLLGALGVYLFISPGVLDTSNTAGDGGAASADAATP
jgi:tRNA threonylcarbamoyl adenosine modification protein TsaD